MDQNPIFSNMNCCVFVNGGKVLFNSCFIVLSLVIKKTKNPIVGLVINEDAHLVLDKCEMNGSSNFPTIGIISNWGNLEVKECMIQNHLCGGMVINSHEKNFVKIYKSEITKNKEFGITCLG